MRSLLLCALCLLPACDSTPASSPDMASSPPDLALPIGADTEVTIFSAVSHLGGQLQNDAMATLPDGKSVYSSITLHVQLGCPAAGCDPYDRIASIGVVDVGSDGKEQVVEVGRYITPFGIKGAWDIDVTDLAPLLSGTRKFRSYLETYAQGGQGWTVTATLKYKGGLPANVGVGYTALTWSRLPVGDDKTMPVDASLPPTKVTPPAGATGATLRLFVTGHGQGNADNCAEFCDLTHGVSVDGMVTTKSLWRDDCMNNPLKLQHGSWQAPREGWCPGEDVKPWTMDLGARSSPFTIAYATPTVDDGSGAQVSYANDCQPTNCNLQSCAFGTQLGPKPCDYNDSWHTSPNFDISAIVIWYRH